MSGSAVVAGGSHDMGADTMPRSALELAKSGWLVEVHLISEGEPDSRFFVVGTHQAGDAEEAILRYPGIIREDKRTARRRLSDKEIACLRLRPDGVRPYILESEL